MQKINELELAKKLIRYPSITPKDAGAINFLSKQLRSLGFKCKILEFKDKKSTPIKNLYARLGTKQPNLCYAGHTDVVPPGDINDWTVNPFKALIKKNYLVKRTLLYFCLYAAIKSRSLFIKNHDYSLKIC